MAGEGSPFAAQVKLSSKLPALMLEDLEHHLELIQCDENSVKLGFSSVETLKLAHGEFMKTKKFYLVTSHEGCNNEGERDVHLVSTVSLHEESNTILLSATRKSWDETFRKVGVSFGGSTETFDLRRHGELRKRQDNTPSEPTSTRAATAPSGTASWFPKTPTESPANYNISDDFRIELIDRPILPLLLDSLVDINFAVIPNVPGEVTVACKNCTVRGTIGVFQGFFSMANTQEAAEDENMTFEFFTEDGFLELRADDVAAHIELESAITLTSPSGLTTFELPLPEIGLPGFTIPGIATVGPIFRPVVSVGFQVSTTFNFTYGFDLAIPNNSRIRMNIAELGNSTETGFSNTSITALPFQAPSSLPDPEITISAGFFPRLLLGISVGHRALGANAGAGVIFGLPKLEASIVQVPEVDGACGPRPAPNSTVAQNDNSLTLIEPSVSFELGLIAEGSIGIGGGIQFDAAHRLMNRTFPLEKQCLRFDTEANSFAPAVTEAQTEGGKGGDQDSAGVVGKNLGGSLRMLVLGLLGVMGAFVVAL